MALGARPLLAHPLPLEVVVYLEAGAGGVRAVVHIPAAFLADARLPRRDDGYLDLARIDGPMSGVASYVARTLDLTIDGRPLPAPSVTWTISRALDGAVEDFQAASARAAAPRPAVDARVNPDTMAVDLTLAYQLPTGGEPRGSRSLRANDFRAPNQNTRMRIVDVSDAGSPRTIVTAGTARRIDLDPGWFDVLGFFARRGLDQLRQSTGILLFVLCLAIPRRPLNEAIAPFTAFAVGCLAALVLVGGTAASSMAPAFRAGSAGLLVVAALQNITGARMVWTRAVALAFGVCEGVVMGSAYASDAALSGTHVLAALAAYAAPVAAGALLFLLLARPLVDLAYQSRLQERWAVLLLSAIPIHSGLHGVLGMFRS
jgi:HupE / UreJ protein